MIEQEKDRNNKNQSILSGRYAIGQVLENNGKYTSYIGFDLRKGESVYILECKTGTIDNNSLPQHLGTIKDEVYEMCNC